jgi:hypothetical protein
MLPFLHQQAVSTTTHLLGTPTYQSDLAALRRDRLSPVGRSP